MKLMILGASLGQLIGIQKAKALGYEVVTCDYLTDAVGHEYGDWPCYVSTFDSDKVLKAAKYYQIDGIMTLGTDQPVYTAAKVATSLGLLSHISQEVGLAVTNKRVMKALFNQANIQTAPYILYEIGDDEEKLKKLQYPVVVKPVDSQGQRGVYLLNSPEEVMKHYQRVIAFSREKKILVEVYYPSDEITVSGWVVNGKAQILTVTDRITFLEHQYLGICLAHRYPSKYLSAYSEDIERLTQELVTAFAISNGPIYFQMLMGHEGIWVNEIACRIGGAFEGVFIPQITGIDIVAYQIQSLLGKTVDENSMLKYAPHQSGMALSVELFFSKPCLKAQITDRKSIMALEGVLDVGYHIDNGASIGAVQNATSRIGYCIIEASSQEELEERLLQLYKKLKIENELGDNCIIHAPIERGFS